MWSGLRVRRAAVVAVAVAVATGVLGTGVGVETAGAASDAHVAAHPSPGCTSRTPAAASETESFSADGDASTYVEQAPANTNPGVPLPVIFDFHGYEQPGQTQVVLSGLGTLGQRAGFVTVTPWIDNEPVPMWRSTVGSRDLVWFGHLLAHVEATSCVDENRVYVTGYSNGAFMTSAIACQYAGQIAAAAPVAGIQALPSCRRSRPVPVVAFHGTADPLVSYTGVPTPDDRTLATPDGSGHPMSAAATGVFGARGIFSKGPTVPQEAAEWARRNGCTAAFTTSAVADGVALLKWSCPRGADVELYRVTGGGHTWPGSRFTAALPSLGATTLAISADTIMWAFFRAHPLTAND